MVRLFILSFFKKPLGYTTKKAANPLLADWQPCNSKTICYFNFISAMIAFIFSSSFLFTASNSAGLFNFSLILK